MSSSDPEDASERARISYKGALQGNELVCSNLLHKWLKCFGRVIDPDIKVCHIF